MENYETERFIAEIRCRSAIWDHSLDDYSNRELKKKCWEEIVDIFGESEMTTLRKKELETALQKKWKNLRCSFTRELQRQRIVKSGLGSAPRKSEYVFFKLLSFLHGVATTRNVEIVEDSGDTNIGMTYDIDEPEIEYFEEQKDQGLKRKISTSEQDTLLVIVNKLITESERREQEANDEDRMFLLSLINPLKSVKMEKRMAVKIQLMNVINDAQSD